jgi:hypothetical protein
MSSSNCRHKWVGHRNPGTPDGPGEYVEYCDHCGTDRDAVEAAQPVEVIVSTLPADFLTNRPGICRRCGGTWPDCCICGDDSHWTTGAGRHQR